MKRPRVLYLCPRAPWLLNGGAMLRNYWMIDALAKQYAVDLIVADERGEIPPLFAALIDDGACFARDAGRGTTIGRLARAAAFGETTLTAGWISDELREHVANRLGRYPYAAIQVDLPMIGALPRRDVIPIVYNAHNCESALLERRARAEAPHVGAALALDAFRVRRQERALIQRAALVAVCADQDLIDFESFAPGVRAKSAIVPNGVDVQRYAAVRSMPASPRTVLITGSMDWRPNVLGLRWFLRHALQRLRTLVPDAVVRVAGRMQAELVAELTAAGVEAVPNPASMEPHLADATIVAAPIVASSGTRLRILEAWAAGRPVVTTSAGAFGLQHTPGVELLVGDEPIAFADAAAALLQSPERRAQLAAAAAQRVKAYDWPRIGARLLEVYERIAIADGPARTIPTVSGETYAFFGKS